MQQLSLFDFGEEAPKPEKKKKAPINGIEQSASSKEKDNIPEPTEEKSATVQEEPNSFLEGTTAVPTPPEQPVLPVEQEAETTITPATGPAPDPAPAATPDAATNTISDPPTIADTETPDPDPVINESNKEPSPDIEAMDQLGTDQAEQGDAYQAPITAQQENNEPEYLTARIEESAGQHPPSDEDIDQGVVTVETSDPVIKDYNLPPTPPQQSPQQENLENGAPQVEAHNNPADNRSASEEATEEPLTDKSEEAAIEAEYQVQPEVTNGTSTDATIEVQPEQKQPGTTSEQQDSQEPGKEQPTNDVIFANEQFGVKVVLKSVKPDAIDPSPASTVAGSQVADNNEQTTDTAEEIHTSPEATNSGLNEDIDTTFSPDDFGPHAEQEAQEEEQKEQNTELSPEIVQNTTQVAQAPPAIEDPLREADQHSLPTPPKVIEKVASTALNTGEPESPEQITKESTGSKTDKPTENDSNYTENHTNGSNNKGKKPFYVEDQTVPVRKRGRKSFKEIDAEVDLINVPADEDLFQKQYYPISVVAKWFRVNNSLLRFWENEFKILKPRKNKKGDRFFRPEDVKNLQLIYYLLRQKKLTINGAIKHLNSYREQTEVNMQLIQTLNDFKGFLLELRAATEK